MEKETVNLNKYLEETVRVRYEIEGVLKNIHGQYAVRTQEMKGATRVDVDTETEEGEKEKTDTTKKTKKKQKLRDIYTFPKNGDGELIVPLGGARGYLMGALRWAMTDLYKDQFRNRKWEGYGIKSQIDYGIFIQPEWISVGKEISNELEKPKKYMVRTKGIGESVMWTYYDYVEKAPFKLTIDLTNTKMPQKIFEAMLAHVQRLGCGPKKRGQIIFTKVTRLVK